jgi:Spy/CpxP family protein refolding chaperone
MFKRKFPVQSSGIKGLYSDPSTIRLYNSLRKRRKYLRLYLILPRQKRRTAKANPKIHILKISNRGKKSMSFKRKLISAVTSALAVAAFGTFVSAQDTNTNKEDNSAQKQEMRGERGRGGKRGFGGKGMRGGKHGGDRKLTRSLERLNLSDAQKEQVRALAETFKAQTQTEREELRALGMKKRDGIITADEQARFKEVRKQLKASGEQMRNSVLAVLTAEQRAQLDQIKEERKQRMMERRQNRMNRQNQTAPQSEDN